jgi:hypothetical protein
MSIREILLFIIKHIDHPTFIYNEKFNYTYKNEIDNFSINLIAFLKHELKDNFTLFDSCKNKIICICHTHIYIIYIKPTDKMNEYVWSVEYIKSYYYFDSCHKKIYYNKMTDNEIDIYFKKL